MSGFTVAAYTFPGVEPVAVIYVGCAHGIEPAMETLSHVSPFLRVLDGEVYGKDHPARQAGQNIIACEQRVN